ncbi:MAG: tetratricopeptide repeat protein [Patescibacteria group bacterium]
MLSYIIPPIIIVLSLAALILFLFKKSSKIPDEVLLKEKRDAELSGERNRKLFRFTQLILQISEKIMQRFKLFSLKFYNRTDNWFHSIKEKREKRSEIMEGFDKEGQKFPEQESIGKPVVLTRKPNIDNVVPVVRGKILHEEYEEKEVEPMISKEVVQPDPKGEIRNEFERALIERVALNPKDIEAYERLGDYYIEIGNFNDSLSCFEEVLKLSPANRKAKIKIRRLQKIVYSKM